MAPIPPAAQDRHLWQIRWVRDLLIVLVFAIIFAVAFVARAVTLPAFLGLLLAYAFNPVVTWARRRWHVSRVISSTVIVVLLLGLIAGMAAYFLPLLSTQLKDLLDKLPQYLDSLHKSTQPFISRIMRTTEAVRSAASSATSAPASQPAASQPATNEGEVVSLLLGSFNIGLNILSSTLSLAIAILVMIFAFFTFSLHFEGMLKWLDQFIPTHKGRRVRPMIKKMDEAVFGFLRARMLQALEIMVTLSFGWWIAGLKYWLVLAVITGFLNLIPYAPIIAWPLAVMLAFFDATTAGQGFELWHIVVWPSLAYIIAQGIDSWVVEPWLQGRFTHLNPLVILLAVLTGEALAGVFGMLIAVPVAACLKILCQELLVPHLQAWAQGDLQTDGRQTPSPSGRGRG